MHSRRDMLKFGGILTGLALSPFSKAGVASIDKSRRGSGPLRITKVDPLVVSIPKIEGPMSDQVRMPEMGTTTGLTGLENRLNHHFPSRPKDSRFTLLVRIMTDQGITGWGEAHAPLAPTVHAKMISDFFAPLLVGEDALQLLPLWERMYSSQRVRGYSTGVYTESIAGVDIALWDILGKFTGQPVYQLLGGKFRETIPTYTGGRSVESIQESMSAGFTMFKTGFNKSGTEGIDKIWEMSEAIGSKGQLMVDSLGAFKLNEAIRVGREFDRMGNIGWFEDALLVDDAINYPRLSEALDTPVCVGESLSNRFQFRDLLKSSGADIINPDLGRACGITECKRIADLADVFGVMWSPHVSSGMPPYLAASIHLAVATPNAVVMEAGNVYGATDVVSSRGNTLLKEPLAFGPGFAKAPEKPGLGIEFDSKKLRDVVLNWSEVGF